MEKKDFLTTIAQNTPLAIAIVGLILFVIGAAGGLPTYGLTIADPSWRIALGAMGAFTAVAGMFLYARKELRPEDLDPRKYGIKITSPSHRDVVPNKFDLKGTYVMEPPKGIEVRVFELSPISNKYWPKRKVIFEKDQKTWQAFDYSIGGKPDDERIIVVALLGENGQVLWDYYEKAGEEAKHLTGITKLTTDIVECHRITVKRAKEPAHAL